MSTESLGDCPGCGNPLIPGEANGKYDDKQVVIAEDTDLESYHLGCEGEVYEEVHCQI